MSTSRQPVLYTKRLLLRPLEPGDAPGIRAMAGKMEIAENTFMPYPYREGMAEEFIASREKAWIEDTGASFAITLREKERLAGIISLKEVNKSYNRAEMGYWLGTAYWGQGYATEAAREMLKFAFSRLGLNRVFAACFHTNPASCRVLEKAGMKREGIQRQHVYHFGNYKNLILYGALKAEWRQP